MKAISRFIDRGAERGADLAWRGLKRFPYLGVAVAAGATLVVASAIGVAELAITVGVGYLAFQVLRMNVPPSKAIRRAEELEELVR